MGLCVCCVHVCVCVCVCVCVLSTGERREFTNCPSWTKHWLFGYKYRPGILNIAPFVEVDFRKTEYRYTEQQ